MFEQEIEKIEDFCRDLDDKQCKKLKIKQLGNLLCVLSDKGLMDGSQKAESVRRQIQDVYQDLFVIVDHNDMERKRVRAYNKAYNKLVEKVKEAFDLEPLGSIQSKYMAMGIAIGTGLGSALMTVIGPAFISIGTALGVAIGLSIGSQKEKAAKEAGKLY